MPQVRRTVAVAAATTVSVDISPYDRFGLGGGAVSVRALASGSGIAAGEVLMNLTIGSDQVTRDNALPLDATGDGVTQFTPMVQGVGGPADPIDITLQNTDAANAASVDILVDVQNVL